MNKKHRISILLTLALILGATAVHLQPAFLNLSDSRSGSEAPEPVFEIWGAQCNMTDTQLTASIALMQWQGRQSGTLELAFHPPGTTIPINVSEQPLTTPQHPSENITITPTNQFDNILQDYKANSIQFTITMTNPQLQPTPPGNIGITILKPDVGGRGTYCN